MIRMMHLRQLSLPSTAEMIRQESASMVSDH